MASIIRVKRSTGVTAPSTLNYGELGLTVGVGTYGNKGDRLFVGDNSSNPQVIGGRYFTDLLGVQPGRVAGQSNPSQSSNGFVAILDQDRKVDQWNVDNLRLDGNTLSSTDTDGNITITPNGIGRIQVLDDDEIQFGTSDDIRLSYDSNKDALFIERGLGGATADVRVADDIHFQFGTDNDARIYYDEASTDRVLIEGASWTYQSSVSQVSIAANSASTDSTTGALVVTGGVGVGGNVNINSNLAVEGGSVTSLNANLNLFNANVTAANVLGAATNIVLGASSGIATIRNSTVDLDGDLNVDGGDITSNQTSFNLLNSTVSTARVLGAATNILLGATTGIATIRNAEVDLDGHLNVDNGVYVAGVTTVTEYVTAPLFDSSNLTLAAPQVGLYTGERVRLYDFNDPSKTNYAIGVEGSHIWMGVDNNSDLLGFKWYGGTTEVAKLSATGNFQIDGNITVDGGSVNSNQTEFNLLNSTVTNANVLGAATNIVLGASSGIATIRNSTVDLDGDLNVDGGDITSNLASFNLLATNVINANVLTSAQNIVVGDTTGIATIRNLTLSVPNATTLNFGATSTPTTATFSSTSNTSYVAIAATTNASSTTTGALRVAGGAGIASDLYVGGQLNVQGINIAGGGGGGGDLSLSGNLSVQGNTTLGNQSTDSINIVGVVTHTGSFTNIGGATIDNIGISSNVISTKSGGGNKLYIDPYPDGLSNEGTVIIKGDLQVDGTTTIVNSVTVTSNNPIYVVGDNATVRTVMTTASSGVNVLTLDSVAGINTNDVVTGLNIPSNTVISAINSGTKVITISNNTTGTINSGTEITISQGIDTNDDRGIAFKYVSSGLGTEAVVKTGFFGYVDSNQRWTYVPDAGIAANVVTGTKGFLDIKGIYYQSGDFATNGINYFGSDGLMKSTVAPGAGINTSNYILTTDASGVPTWTDTIDGGMF